MKLYSLEETLHQYTEQGIEIKILNIVKSGKEAMVYRIEINNELYALKLYKDVKVRTFKNNQTYIQNKYIRRPSFRKAVSKKTNIGIDYIQKGWVKREFVMLNKLYNVNCNIPKPYKFTIS